MELFKVDRNYWLRHSAKYLSLSRSFLSVKFSQFVRKMRIKYSQPIDEHGRLDFLIRTSGKGQARHSTKLTIALNLLISLTLPTSVHTY